MCYFTAHFMSWQAVLTGLSSSRGEVRLQGSMYVLLRLN